MNYTKEFGRYIRTARKKAGLSQETLAELCNISTRQISNIERGKCEPKLNTMSIICVECGISFDDFLKDNTSFFPPLLL